MKKRNINIEYTEIENKSDFNELEQNLIEKSIEIAKNSYSPYSNFPVGAAVILENNEVFAGSNQENIAYPSGTCAERTVLNYVHANYPKIKIKTIAIVALEATCKTPVTPCGFCRQVMVEMEQVQNHNIKVILHKINGESYVFESAMSLLPLAFEDENLGKN